MQVGEIEVFRTDGDAERSWLVRFYASGSPAHVAPMPLLEVNASVLEGNVRRRRRLVAGIASVSEVTAVACHACRLPVGLAADGAV